MAWLAVNKNGTVYVTTEIHKKYLRYPVLGLSAHRDYIYRLSFSYSPKQPLIFSFGCAHPFIAGCPLARHHSSVLPERQASAIFPFPAPPSYNSRIRTAR